MEFSVNTILSLIAGLATAIPLVIKLVQYVQKADNAFVKVEMEHTVTCDAPMCDECATRVGADIDLCPSCKKKLKGAIR